MEKNWEDTPSATLISNDFKRQRESVVSCSRNRIYWISINKRITRERGSNFDIKL